MLTLRRNVLIFHQAALGDFVLTWPMAMAAARLWPTNRTIYVTQPGKGALAERAIGVEWRDGDALHGLFSEEGNVPPAATKLLDGATLILSFVSNGNDAWARNVRRLAPAATLIPVRARPDDAFDSHLTMFHAGQVGGKPELQAAIGQMIRHVASSGAIARRPTGERVIVHPGSGGEAKCWPAERFIELVTRLKVASYQVDVILGEAEVDRWSPATVDALRKASDALLAPATLVELFEAITSSRLYIGNDAGPTHLAAISGVPVLALFGRDNDVTWRPLGPRVRVLKRVPLTDLAVEDVASAALVALKEGAETAAPVVTEDE